MSWVFNPFTGTFDSVGAQINLVELPTGNTIIWDAGAAPVATVTLTQNATLFVENFQAGGTYKLIVFQDATGGRTLGYDPDFKWPNDVIPTVSSGANAMTVFEFVSNGTYMYGTVSQAYDGSPAPTVSGLFAAPAGDYSTLTTTTAMPTGGLITRTGNAMYYDSTGRLTYAPNNLLTYSQEFDNAAWSPTRASISPNVAAAPDGTNTADKLVEDTTPTSNHFVGYSATVSGNHIASVYLKASERTWAAVIVGNSTSGTAYFNLSSGAVGTVTAGYSARVTPVGNGWYRCSIAGAAVSSGNATVRIYTAIGDNVVSYSGDGTSGVFVWGAQLEAVTYQTTSTYYPTTNAAYYGPRFDTDPLTLQPKGLLVEGARSNLLAYSEQFDNAAWLQSGTLPVTPNAIVSPDGTQNADLIAATTSVNDFRYQSLTLVLNSQNTFSFFIKNNNSTRSRIVVQNAVTSLDAQLVWTGAALSVTNVVGTTTATAVGNGWYRVEGRFIALETSTQARVYPDTLVGTNSAYFWGAQFEAASFASSYMPSVAAASNRAADTFTISGYANRLVEAYWIEQETGVASSIPETVVSSGAVTISPPTFGWVTSLRAYANAWAGDIATPSWIDNSGTTGNRMYTDSTGTLTWAPHNLLLNSASLATQTVTVTVGATNILSFYGTGSITLSGAATGTLTGTGASNRVSLIVTPTTTSLTLTVSGSVTQAQLERVTYQTQPRAYIPTTNAAVYLPAYDYDASTTPATPRGMRIEEARSNLLTYSQDFADASWNDYRDSSISAASFVAPDGGSARAIVEAATTATHFVRRVTPATIAIGTVYTVSLYAKAAGRNFLQIRGDAALNHLGGVTTFNLSTGAVTLLGSSVTSANIVSVGNGWYRCSITATATGITARVGIGMSDDATVLNNAFKSYAGNGTAGIVLFGCQIEAGEFATCYIPTTTGAASRVPDIVKLTGAALSVAGAATGSAIVQTGIAPAAPWVLTSGDSRRLVFANGNTLAASFNGSVVLPATIGGSGNWTTGVVRSAIGWDANGRSIVANNGTAVTDANTLGTGVNVFLGSNGSSFFANCRIESLALYNSRLPDASLQKKSAVGAAY